MLVHGGKECRHTHNPFSAGYDDSADSHSRIGSSLPTSKENTKINSLTCTRRLFNKRAN